MKTVVKCPKWRITQSDSNIYHVETAKYTSSPWEVEDANFMAVEDAMCYSASRFISIQDSQLSRIHVINESSRTYVKGSNWRIAVQDDCYTVQLREKKSMAWNHKEVRTIATYGNIEGAILRLTEFFQNINESPDNRISE